MKALIEKIETTLDALKIYEESVRWQTEKANKIRSTEGLTDEYYQLKTKIDQRVKVCITLKMFLGISFGVIGYNDIDADPSNLDHEILTSWYNYHIKKESERLKSEPLEQYPESEPLEQYPEEQVGYFERLEAEEPELQPEAKEDWLDKVNKLYQ